MRDKKDNATLDLPGFGPASAPAPLATHRSAPARTRRALPRQEQLELLEQTDASGLPEWQRDDSLDLVGLPVWRQA